MKLTRSLSVAALCLPLATAAVVAAGAAGAAPAVPASTGGGMPYPGTTSSPVPLTGHVWRLRLPGVSTSVFDGARLAVSADGRVSGSDGCNEVTGRATVTAGTVTFDGVAWTRRRCSFEGATQDAYLAASRAMQDALTGTARYSTSENSLTLTSATRSTTSWSPVTTTPASTLTDRAWHLRLPGVDRTIADRAAITIDRTGHLSGTDGCNEVSGEVAVDPAARTMTFGPVTTTRRACTLGTAAADAQLATVVDAVRRTLQGTVTYAQSGASLVITRADGTTVTFGY